MAKKEKIDWGGLLDEAWGDESEDECKPCSKQLRRAIQTSKCRTGADGVARAPTNSQLSELTCDWGVGGEKKDGDSSLLLSDFSPCLFSQTSTPRKADSPKSDTSSPVLKAGRPAFTSDRPGACVGDCAVVVTKCALPSGCRMPLHNMENSKPVHLHKCPNGHLSRFDWCQDSNENKARRNGLTRKLKINNCKDSDTELGPALPKSSNYARHTSTSRGAPTSRLLASYSSPLLFPESTTPSSTLSSSPHAADNNRALCSVAGYENVSTNYLCDTETAIITSPTAVVESCCVDENVQISRDFPSSDDMPENPLTFTDSVTKYSSGVDGCSVQETDTRSPGSNTGVLRSMTVSSPSLPLNCESDVDTRKLSGDTSASRSHTPVLCIYKCPSNTFQNSQTISRSLSPSLISQPATLNSSLLSTATVNSTLSTPLTTLSYNSNQSTPLSSTRSTPLAVHSSNQTSISVDCNTKLTVPSTAPTNNCSLLATPTNQLTTPSSSSNQSASLTVTSSGQRSLLTTPTLTASTNLPLSGISLHSLQTTSRDTTPSMQPGLTTGRTTRGRRLVLVPYTHKCRRERGIPGKSSLTERGRERKMRSSQNRQRRTDSSRGSNQKKEQLYLDFGQRSLGHTTCCVCGMVYTSGLDDDVREHSKFHRRFLAGITFHGWKTERVVCQYFDGRVIVILPSDPKRHLKKVRDLCCVVDTELGYAEGVKPWHSDAKIFLYVSTEKKVMGCVVAEKIDQGYRVMSASPPKNGPNHLLDDLSAWYCSSEAEPARVGINRIWVSRQYRRRGVASRLLDAVRLHFHVGMVLSERDLAFSDPTPDGKALATHYCHTHNFLVYHWTNMQ